MEWVGERGEVEEALGRYRNYGVGRRERGGRGSIGEIQKLWSG